MLAVKVGDVVHVRAELVGEIDSDGEVLVQVKGAEQYTRQFYCAPSEIVHVETRPLQVGDRVKGPRTDLTLQILAIVGSHAWTCAAETAPGTVLGSTYPLASLERV